MHGQASRISSCAASWSQRRSQLFTRGASNYSAVVAIITFWSFVVIVVKFHISVALGEFKESHEVEMTCIRSIREQFQELKCDAWITNSIEGECRMDARKAGHHQCSTVEGQVVARRLVSAHQRLCVRSVRHRCWRMLAFNIKSPKKLRAS